MISILDTRDPDAVRAYERAFYTAFRRATANRLVRKLWLWDDAEGRVATRIPYSDQRIYTLVGRSGGIHAALAVNLAMREFQSAAFGFTPAERDGAVEVLTFFSTSSDVGGTTRLFRSFVEDIHGSGRHTAFATTAERPFRVYRRIGWELVAEGEIESERRYFLRFDLRRHSTKPRVNPRRICARVRSEEVAMLNRLLRLWHGFCGWLMQRPAEPAHHGPVSQPYQPSNLHARHYR